MLTRRKFLTNSGVLTLLPFLPANATQVSQPVLSPKQFFVIVRAIGGMDVTLGLDPWTGPLPLPTDMFVEYDPTQLIEPIPGMKLGPSLAPLKAHASDLAIVNGVFMSQLDNGHDAPMIYLTNGSPKPGTPSLAVEVARSSFEGEFGVLFNQTLSKGDRIVTSSSVDNLMDIPRQRDLSLILQAFLGEAGSTPYTNSIVKVIKSQTKVKKFIDHLLKLNPSGHYSVPEILASSFLAELSATAQWDLSINLDTHANHQGTHLTNQKEVWTSIDQIFSLFKNTPIGQTGESLFDRTTFLVISEFARTPALNAAGGKDHNPLTNSLLLAGCGVKGGQVVGGSRLVTAKESPTGSSYHIAYPIDYSTCQVQRSRTPQAQMIFPENIAETVAQILKLDRSLYQTTPVGTQPLSVLIKT